MAEAAIAVLCFLVTRLSTTLASILALSVLYGQGHLSLLLACSHIAKFYIHISTQFICTIIHLLNTAL